jgi:hypothetical protein
VTYDEAWNSNPTRTTVHANSTVDMLVKQIFSRKSAIVKFEEIGSHIVSGHVEQEAKRIECQVQRMYLGQTRDIEPGVVASRTISHSPMWCYVRLRCTESACHQVLITMISDKKRGNRSVVHHGCLFLMTKRRRRSTGQPPSGQLHPDPDELAGQNQVRSHDRL